MPRFNPGGEGGGCFVLSCPVYMIKVIPTYFFRSDAESVSTSVSQDSNKENHSNPSPSNLTVAGEEDLVVRRNKDAKVRSIPLRCRTSIKKRNI